VFPPLIVCACVLLFFLFPSDPVALSTLRQHAVLHANVSEGQWDSLYSKRLVIFSSLFFIFSFILWILVKR